MAGMLPKNIANFHKIKGSKISIIASQWHSQIVERMIASAVTQLKNVEVIDTDIEVIWSPGSLEIPFYVAHMLQKKNTIDALICFGVVLKGGTTHDLTVLESVATGLSQLVIKHVKPIINEVIGVQKLEDAEERAVDKGVEAVFAATEAIYFQKSYGQLK